MEIESTGYVLYSTLIILYKTKVCCQNTTDLHFLEGCFWGLQSIFCSSSGFRLYSNRDIPIFKKTMKFVTETLTRCKPRLGVLKEIESQLGLQIETPCAMLYTKVSIIESNWYDLDMWIFGIGRVEAYRISQTKFSSWSVSSHKYYKFPFKALTILIVP